MTSSSDPALTSSSAQLKEAESLQRLVREQQEIIQVLHQTIEKMLPPDAAAAGTHRTVGSRS